MIASPDFVVLGGFALLVASPVILLWNARRTPTQRERDDTWARAHRIGGAR